MALYSPFSDSTMVHKVGQINAKQLWAEDNDTSMLELFRWFFMIQNYLGKTNFYPLTWVKKKN